MDVVPVAVRIEERFGVRFPLADWPPTVGDLYLALLSRTRLSEDACPTGRAFYHLRCTLTSEFAISRQQVRPAARLCDLFPAARRDADWPRLTAALGLSDLPGLPRRRVPSMRAFRRCLVGVTACWWVVYPVLLLATGDQFSLSYGLLIWFLLALVVVEWFGIFWVAWALDYLSRVGEPRVRDIVVPLAVRHAIQSADRDPTPQRLWDELRVIIAEEGAVPVGEIHPWQRWGDLPDYL